MMITSPFVRPSAKSTASAPKAVYQSAAIVKHLAVKRRKPAPDIWQDSDDTEPMDEDVEEAEAHAESDGEKDMTIDESETVDELESQGSGAATPRPTANATTDMDLDEDASALLHRQPDDSLEPKDESLGQSIGASAPPAAQQTSVDEPSSLASSIYQPIHADTPPFGPEINDESQSQSQSLDLARNNESSLQDGTQEDSHSRRLTDISELKSSMEMQESSQIVVEPTQVEYDIEVYNNMTNASDGAPPRAFTGRLADIPRLLMQKPRALVRSRPSFTTRAPARTTRQAGARSHPAAASCRAAHHRQARSRSRPSRRMSRRSRRSFLSGSRPRPTRVRPSRPRSRTPRRRRRHQSHSRPRLRICRSRRPRPRTRRPTRRTVSFRTARSQAKSQPPSQPRPTPPRPLRAAP